MLGLILFGLILFGLIRLGLILLRLILLLFLERFEFAIHEIAIEFRIGIIGTQLQRGVVYLHRLGPSLDSLCGVALFRLLSLAVECIAEVIVSVLLFGQTFRTAGFLGVY